ncbi:MAG: FAD-dependent oxidoreductase, partial [Desulfobacterales bacterium]|nr:FAD-dependent oxidoreductase [Desulfobacterales bacterium]
LAAAPPGREEFAQLARDLENQIAVRSISVCLNTPVDEALIDRKKPDHIILTTGAAPMTPPVPGIELPHVVQSWDVLSGKVYTGKNVVVVGGGAVGVETALFLAEKGTLSAEALRFLFVNRAEDPEVLYEMATTGTKQVTVLEMMEKIGKDFGKTTRWCMLQDVSRYGIATRVAAKALEITKKGIKIEAENGPEEIPADTVVLSIGAKSNNGLRQCIESKGIACTVAGDAENVGMAFDAVHQGFNAGLNV